MLEWESKPDNGAHKTGYCVHKSFILFQEALHFHSLLCKNWLKSHHIFIIYIFLRSIQEIVMPTLCYRHHHQLGAREPEMVENVSAHNLLQNDYFCELSPLISVLVSLSLPHPISQD
jgi:hypothetical protein